MDKDYVALNREVWTDEAPLYAQLAERLWPLEQPEWGVWGVGEENLGLLPKDMSGMSAIELGCGTAYVSGWMARRGATVTAIDVTPAQLATAQTMAERHAAEITLIEGNAEATGLPDASFDFAISEFGASIWCKPDAWLPEAYRLLRPGGQLVFLGNHPLSLICAPLSGAPNDRSLHRPYRDMWGADWSTVEIDPSGVCFNLTVGDWFTLFRKIGFAVENYQEIYAPPGSTGVRASIPADWAADYPVEQVWHLRK